MNQKKNDMNKDSKDGEVFYRDGKRYIRVKDPHKNDVHLFKIIKVVEMVMKLSKYMK